ncbi:LysR family transcriptional regulator [Rugamonas sp.]|uniref:LysR family transcriptional regulator n=1 Tax=Rugamonas sp. TaxID=1926287 RepID=UPI0025F01EE4|nr:LysR family transcriptional regulator [Rugamonas sp.]
MTFDERVVNGMRVLDAIVDSGSFVGAGELLGMSQSGVSRALAKLEARLKIRLFDRTTRKVALTDEGRRFYAQIGPLLAGLEEAVASAGRGAVAVRGRLRINVDPYFSRIVLGPRLGAFLARHPDLELELTTRDQLGDMIGDGFDLALRFGQLQASTLIARQLMSPRILTVATPDYVRRCGLPRVPADLENGRHTCIHFRDPHTGKAFDWEFHRGAERVVVAPDSQLMVNDAGTLYSVCLAGYGMAQVMDLAVQPMLASGQLVQLLPDWSDERFPLYALYPSRRHAPAKTRAFLAFIESLSHG